MLVFKFLGNQLIKYSYNIIISNNSNNNGTIPKHTIVYSCHYTNMTDKNYGTKNFSLCCEVLLTFSTVEQCTSVCVIIEKHIIIITNLNHLFIPY